MDALSISTALKYYKRQEVQEAIARHAGHREVSPRYGQGFGKRPDVIENPRDVLEFATRKATSFHCSEERWEQPMRIRTGQTRKEANDLRIGWDLVLDIDAPNWQIAKLTAWLFIGALERHGITSVSCKFSGNKGWHIGVPFEAFPRAHLRTDGTDTPMAHLFPEMPRAIATYLVEYIGNPENGLVAIDEDEVLFGGRIRTSLAEIAEKAGKTKRELLTLYCPTCHKTASREAEEHVLLCGSCGRKRDRRYTAEEKSMILDEELACPSCGKLMDFHQVTKRDCPHNPSGYQQRFKITEVVEFDTILLASRHLFRMPYSLHEKSGLVSAVIDPTTVLSFKKTDARPDAVDFTRTFLNGDIVVPGEAAALAKAAWERSSEESRPQYAETQYAIAEDAIPEEFFPPCMRNILNGLEDGKKRAMFALVNFLQVSGWPPELIDQKVHEWNKRNPEPLREVTIKGHLRQHLQKKMKILPPNCMSFYQEMGVCAPDDLCRRVRNPAQYAAKKQKLAPRKRVAPS